MQIRRQALMFVAVTAAMAVFVTPAGAWTRTVINPCTPDSATSCEFFATKWHEVYMPTAPARNQLAIFFHGTLGKPSNNRKIAEYLAGQGFHVMSVKYDADTTAKSACPDSVETTDPNCFRRFRGESVFGENVSDPVGQAFDHSSISVSKPNSVMNRVLNLATYLSTNYAAQGWAQFQMRDVNGNCTSTNTTYNTCDMRWSLAGIGGHSQGSGIALYLSKFFGLRQVAMLSGPQDTWASSAANWIAEGGFTTSSSVMWGFAHTADGEYSGQSLAWGVLGIPGGLTDQAVGSPWGGSHRLTTSVAPACIRPTAAHGSTVTDDCTPGTPPIYQPVWLATYGG
ncbi:MAG: hypothetical protein WD844_13240 [Thermoleophilaceae bacterium]